MFSTTSSSLPTSPYTNTSTSVGSGNVARQPDLTLHINGGEAINNSLVQEEMEHSIDLMDELKEKRPTISPLY